MNMLLENRTQNLTVRLIPRFIISTIKTILVSLVVFNTYPAFSGLSFTRGTPSSIGPVEVSSSPDSATLTGGFISPGTLNLSLSIPVNRIQYDLINSTDTSLISWTLFYSPSLASDIIGAYTPIGYVDSTGNPVLQGGFAYTTLFNNGFGVYTYNTGAPWSIDYEADHITFASTTATGAPALPGGAGVGVLAPTSFLPSFAIEFSPDLAIGDVPATAMLGGAVVNGTVLGPVAAPEPSSLALSLLAVVGWFFYKARTRVSAQQH